RGRARRERRLGQPQPPRGHPPDGVGQPRVVHAAERAGRAQLVEQLAEAGYVVLPADGTWFVTIDLAASGLPADDEAVCERLLREAGVASIPVSAFYREGPEKGYLRLCFAKEEATLEEAIGRLTKFRSEAVGSRQ
ncbi:MAG TPA: aminotransferase class I/II-fold pyridoxal phosphate-dependent enzyme, partial [Croceibacterium sp.]|nr:aminotransferase class I/II-fold pyridoxal phosphate-dependent enzyme [Croceibacterium sp.]